MLWWSAQVAVGGSCLPVDDGPGRVELHRVERSGALAIDGDPSALRVTVGGEPVEVRGETLAGMSRVWPASGRWPDGVLQLVVAEDGEDAGKVVVDLEVVDGPSTAGPPLGDGWVRRHDGRRASLRTNVRLAPGTHTLELDVRDHGVVARRKVAYDGEHVVFEVFRPERCTSGFSLPVDGELTLRLVGVGFDGRRAYGAWERVAPSVRVRGPVDGPEVSLPKTLPTWRVTGTSAQTSVPRGPASMTVRPAGPPVHVGLASEDVVALVFDEEAVRTVHLREATLRYGERTWTVEPLWGAVSALEIDGVLVVAGATSPHRTTVLALGDEVQTTSWPGRPGWLQRTDEGLMVPVRDAGETWERRLSDRLEESARTAPRSQPEDHVRLCDAWVHLGNSGTWFVDGPHPILGFDPPRGLPVQAVLEVEDGFDAAWVAEGAVWRQRFRCGWPSGFSEPAEDVRRVGHELLDGALLRGP